MNWKLGYVHMKKENRKNDIKTSWLEMKKKKKKKKQQKKPKKKVVVSSSRCK